MDSAAEAEERTLTLREERLTARKEVHQAGEVSIRKEVDEVPGRLEVEAYREEVHVEHVPVDKVVREKVSPWEEGDTLVIPVYEEQLVVVKRLVMRVLCGRLCRFGSAKWVGPGAPAAPVPGAYVGLSEPSSPLSPFVIPTEVGIQAPVRPLDARFRGHDDESLPAARFTQFFAQYRNARADQRPGRGDDREAPLR